MIRLSIFSIFLAFITACSSPPLTYEESPTTYPKASELWDYIDRDALENQRRSSDGFSSPLSCTKAFMRDVFSSHYDRAFLTDDRFCAKYFSSALRFQLATSKLQYDKRKVGKDGSPPYGRHAIEGRHKGTIFNAVSYTHLTLPTIYSV